MNRELHLCGRCRSIDQNDGLKLNVLELYSGIGGMHFALSELFENVSNVTLNVTAMDINTSANVVYDHNFKKRTSRLVQNRNICSLSPQEVDAMSLDLLTASPPCQPFTRQGSKRDMQDARTNSFQHLLENVLPYLKCPPRNILIENVKGFETSKMRDMLIRTLRQTNYDYAEFLLEPQALGIPNSRLRYYCLAKLAPATFCFDQSDPKHIISQFPCTLRPDRCLSCDNTLLNRRSSLKVTSQKLCDFVQTEHEVDSKYLIAPAILTRYYPVFDIVDKESVQSCCFTKGYGTLVKGAGSYFTPMPLQTVLDTFHQFEQIHREVGEIDQIPERHVKQLQQTRLRYFTSIEIARLLRFPEHFSFPDNYSDKQKWRLLGNSINVHVVCNLMMLLLAEMSSNS